ncbi:MAG: hypothetical protein F4Z04_00355 [Acidobacteria bacterium]|nr:hypothetical protein [Acidobacteriota bacterium]
MLPFLTSYDPPGNSEGTLDPLGLYQIADRLAVQLVPAVRERMQRIRLLTAIAVGALVTEGLEDDPRRRDVSPYLVWEWLVVESLVRMSGDDPTLWGVPGTQVTRRALDQHGYLDARSYLKTPRIFGFHGVYKRLANHLGIVDVHLGLGPNAEPLVDAWARGMGLRDRAVAGPLLLRWRDAVRRSQEGRPPRTKPNWRIAAWDELATAFGPSRSKKWEQRCLRNLLLASDDRRLGALPMLWELQATFEDDRFREELLHDHLEARAPELGPLLRAIRSYEAFVRSLQDGFDVLRAEAAGVEVHGFAVPQIAADQEFERSVRGLHERFEAAHEALSHVSLADGALPNLFTERFRAFAEPMNAAECALALCTHHETVQRQKSADGKRPWFDRLGQDRIYIRRAYREPRREIKPDRYVHDYRGQPIRRFRTDLS